MCTGEAPSKEADAKRELQLQELRKNRAQNWGDAVSSDEEPPPAKLAKQRAALKRGAGVKDRSDATAEG